MSALSKARPSEWGQHSWATSTSTSTSANTGMVALVNSGANMPNSGLVIPFARFSHPSLEAPKGRPTASAIEQDRFATPMQLLAEALAFGLRMAQEAPAKYRFPTAAALREALKVLYSLPPNGEAPEPAVEPTGTVLWSWTSDDAFLVLGVDGRGQLQRSSVVDGKEGVDATPLSDSFSPPLLDLLARFRVSHA